MVRETNAVLSSLLRLRLEYVCLFILAASLDGECCSKVCLEKEFTDDDLSPASYDLAVLPRAPPKPGPSSGAPRASSYSDLLSKRQTF